MASKVAVVTDLYDPPEKFDDAGHVLLGTDNDLSLWYQKDPSENAHHITATNSNNGIIGHFYWASGDGKILGVHTHPSFQRRGLATKMYNSAKQLSSENGFVSPVHSDNRTDEGRSWVRSVDGEHLAAAKKPAKPKVRAPEEVWYDVHKHPEGVPGGMGKSPEYHLRNRGWSPHEIHSATAKTIQYHNREHPDFMISYGAGTSQKPDHNFRVLYMGDNTNIPKVTRAYSVAEAMNKVEELHGLHSGLVVQPMTHGAAATPPSQQKQPGKVPMAPKPEPRDMNEADSYPEFPNQPTKGRSWWNPDHEQLKEIPDPPAPKPPKYSSEHCSLCRKRSILARAQQGTWEE